MTPMKIALAFLFPLVFTEVASWTIDLPEYRKHLFEESGKDEQKKENLRDFNKDELFFDNIVPDSPHNKDELDGHKQEKDHENDVYGERYAEDYGYMSYMEKKVHGIVHNGSVYLEGLRRALENYAELLTNCSRLNMFQPTSATGPWQPENERPFPGNFNRSDFSLPPFDPLRQTTPLPPGSDQALSFVRMQQTFQGPAPQGVPSPQGPINGLPGTFSGPQGFNGAQGVPSSSGAFPGTSGGPINGPPRLFPGASTFQIPQSTNGVSSPSNGASGSFPGPSSGPINVPSGPGASTFQSPQSTNGVSNPSNGASGSFPGPSSSQGLFSFPQNPLGTQAQSRPFFNSPMGLNGLDRETCERATQSSEHVRRLAQLALWATRELQDRAYAKKYDKQSHDDRSEEEEAEMELLLRLAFFLDKLALVTGFEPDPGQFTPRTPLIPSLTTPPPPPLSPMGAVPADVTRAMTSCLQDGGNSSVPATERCRYPLPHPDFIKKFFNVTDPPDMVQPITTEPAPPRDPSYSEVFRNPTGYTRQKRDLTENKDMTASWRNLDTLSETMTKNRQKRDVLTNSGHLTERDSAYLTSNIDDELSIIRQKRAISTGETNNDIKDNEIKNSKEIMYKGLASNVETLLTPVTVFIGDNFPEKQENRQKRSLENSPLEKLANYYIKYKVWTGSNTHTDSPTEFDVNNHLTTEEPHKIVKRSLTKKSQHMRLPEDPFQDISNFIKHKEGVHYVTDEKETEKLREYLQKVRQSDSLTSKAFFQKLLKVQSRKQKRSIKYEPKFLPNPSEDPRQDISYYQKNKPGTQYQNNLVQAAQVRAGLEQVYQNGNILVAQRYGSNYNPAIPNPLGFGIVRSFFLDI